MFSRDRASSSSSSFASIADVDSLRAELVQTASEIRREMRAYVSELQTAIKDGEGRSSQLDTRIRALQEVVRRLGKLEQDLKAETQRNVDQGQALLAAQDAIAQLQAANHQLQQAHAAKDIAIAKEASVAAMFGRFLGAIAVALLGAGAAGLLWYLAGENMNHWVLNGLIVATAATSFLVFTGHEQVAVDMLKNAGNNLPWSGRSNH